MYYIAKLIQATGLTIILIGFFLRFPKLMDTKVFGFGIIIFVLGWIIQQFMLKK